jgi:serine/threonine protein kinase
LLDERHEIRIADFGRRCEGVEIPDAPIRPLTSAPEVLETSEYPNQADVYSYGICLYLLFAEAIRLDGQNLIRRVVEGAICAERGDS